MQTSKTKKGANAHHSRLANAQTKTLGHVPDTPGLHAAGASPHHLRRLHHFGKLGLTKTSDSTGQYCCAQPLKTLA